jgi:hypothetical protein
MKTSLHFEAPSDLSVGTVRIVGKGKTIADWVATPDNRIFRGDDVHPGVYSAEITPAGVAPQSVVFEIHAGQANNVVLPTFSALAASGSNTSFFDAERQQTLAEVPYSTVLHIMEGLDLPSLDTTISGGTVDVVERVGASDIKRRICVGLSEETHKRNQFKAFKGKPKIELFGSRVEITIPTDSDRDLWSGNRVRLAADIEGVRVERCLLPLYRGGTRIVVAVPSFDAADLELAILPVDPKLRALVRTLDAGTSGEASAVRIDVLGVDSTVFLTSKDEPWSAILAGLLAIRFPEVFPPIDPAWAELLAMRAPWAFDAQVVRANQVLVAASTLSSERQGEAVAQAIDYLARAQSAQWPYYRYASQLFDEMATGIANYLKTDSVRVAPDAVKLFERIHSRWYRELPLQHGAGPTFSWMSRDPNALRRQNIVAPNRRSTGRLRSRDTLIVLEGRVSAGQITIIGERSSAPGSAAPPQSSAALPSVENRLESDLEDDFFQMPALGRSPGPEDDPNKGRFGGQATSGGCSLTAAFEPTANRHVVTIVLTVEAERSAKVGVGDCAWFVLHPTFSPAALRVAFRGSRACLSIQAWGGFTVGVWLPKKGLELECDLALIEDAPHIIRSQ